MAKTPAIAAAERAGVRFAVHEYDHDPGAAYGLEAAATVELTSWWRINPSYTLLKMNLHTGKNSTDTISGSEGT